MTMSHEEDNRRLAGSTGALASDLALVAALRDGDEAAFAGLLDRYGGAMLRIAMIYVPNRAAAEDVVQETWLAVLQGLSRFEGRSSLRTWIFRILTNRAKTRGQRERRSVPLSALEEADTESFEPAVAADRFLPREHDRWPGHWAARPDSWDHMEQRLLAQETRAYIDAAIAALPANQRSAISLRDIEGLSADEVCAILDITEGNQRVLLHRARSKIRAALERYLAEAEVA